MKRTIKIIAAVIIILVIPAIIQKVMFRKEDPAKVLTRLASETNAGLPKRMDAITTLTRVDFDRNVWRINYTMDKGAPVDPSQINHYRNFALKQICGSDMKRMLDNKITVEYFYTYTDATGEQNMRISIPPGSCA